MRDERVRERERLTFGDGVGPGAGTVEVERTAVEDLGEVGLSVGLSRSSVRPPGTTHTHIVHMQDWMLTLPINCDC